jgi:hypothetical protein
MQLADRRRKIMRYGSSMDAIAVLSGTIHDRLGVIWAVSENGRAAMSAAIPHDI